MAMHLRITDAARAKVIEARASAPGHRGVAAIAWVSAGVCTSVNSDGRELSSPVEPHWGLGFYDPANLSADQVQDVLGIPFLIDEALDGKLLDFENGRFHVR